MKRLLLLDYFRGPDSTGLAAIRGNGDIKIAKRACNPLDLFDVQKFKDALSGYNSKIFIGHNRAATKGLVNNENAHPFEFDHIVGAHNGTLEMSSWKALEEAIGEKFAVDSQALICAIARLGIEETMKLAEGAWSLVWYDSDENTLNFLRNEKRPMWYCFEEDFKRILWASEWESLDNATRLSTAGYKLYSEVHDNRNCSYFATGVNIHYKFDMKTLATGGTTRPKPVAKELKGKEPTPVKAAHNPFGRNPTPGGTQDGSSHNSSTIQTTPSLGTNAGSCCTLFGDYGIPLAGVIDADRFQELAQHGCAWCGDTVSFQEVGVTIFERDDILICSKCSSRQSPPASKIYMKDITQLINV